MAIKKTITKEEGQIILDKLRNDKEYLAQFLISSDVTSILEAAIRSRGLQNKVTVVDFVSAIFIYSSSNQQKFPSAELNDPGALYGYFRTTVRRLLGDRNFMRTLVGIDPGIKEDNSIDAKEEGRRSLAETLIYEESDNYSEIADKKVERFREIVSLVYIKNPKYGELLQRTYLNGEKAEKIAEDFVKRGYFKNKDTCAAVSNIQNSLLPRARKQFNLMAEKELELKGKVKKSIIKELNKVK